MEKNMGMIDRIIRIIVALLVLILYIAGFISGWTAIILGIIAVIFLLTSVISMCPLYKPLGISTKKKA